MAPASSRSNGFVIRAAFVVASLTGGVLAAVTVASCRVEAKPPAAQPAADAAKAVASPKDCKTDADCVTVPDDCCGCAQGGAQRALPKKQKEAYEKERSKRCGGTMCAQMMSQHPSCSEQAVCRTGACVLARKSV